MVEYKLSNLPRIVLDPRQDAELFDQAKNRTIAASNGKLTNFTKSSALTSLITTQVFCQAELLWYLNKLPSAIAIELLRLFGVTRSLGTKARGAISILLAQSLTNNFVLPSGYPLKYRDNISFVTLGTLVIPPGSYEGTVDVECSVVGTVGNIEPLGLTQTSPGLNYVQMIYNKKAIGGGTNIEPLEATILRGQESIRRRDTLVTLADYEAACQDILGYGSKAVAVAAMDAAKRPDRLGNVHVFLVDSQGVPPNPTICENIKSSLQNLTFAGSGFWVSPVQLQPIHLEAVLDVIQIDDQVASGLLEAVSKYLNPANYSLGSILRVKELEYVMRLVGGVEGIQYVTINSTAVNLPMPQKYFAPNLITFVVTLVTPDGIAKTYNLLQETDPD